MQIAEILSAHVAPGAVVYDLTRPDAELSTEILLAPEAGVTYRDRLAAGADAPAVGIVLQQLPVASEPPGAVAVTLERDVGRRTVHVLFCDRPDSLVACGVLVAAAEGGWELSGLHATGHQVFRYAAVFVAAEARSSRPALRLVNEYRYLKVLLREREQELAATRARHDDLARQLAERDAALLAARRSLDDATRAAQGDRARAAEALEEQRRRLARARERLIRARRSVAFRIGRATRVALRGAARDPLGVPRRWFETFRGPDEIVDDL